MPENEPAKPSELTAKAQALLQAVLPETDGLGVIIVVSNVRGLFSSSSNMAGYSQTALLEHLIKHIKGECKC